MRAVFVVIANVFRQQRLEMSLVYRNDVIQQVPSAAFNPTLGNAIGMSVQLHRMAMLKFDVSE